MKRCEGYTAPARHNHPSGRVIAPQRTNEPPVWVLTVLLATLAVLIPLIVGAQTWMALTR